MNISRLKIAIALSIFLGIAVIILCQFSIKPLFDADGYLHIRMSEFIRHYGLKYDFHWARYSTFAKNFSDKDLLFHIFCIPFTFLPNMFFGAKVAAAIFAVSFFLVFFWLLKRYCLGGLIPFFLLALFCSSTFLHSLCRMRPMIPVIGLTILFAHFLIRKNVLALFVTSLLYALSHVSGPYLLVWALLAEGTRFISQREFHWKGILSVVLGLAAGFLIHPNFPNNFLVFYLNGILVPIFSLKWGLELGGEFFPLDTREYALGYPFLLIALFILIAASTSRNRISVATKIWLAISGFFFAFSFFSQRYLIYAYPLALLSLASYIKDRHESKDGPGCLANKRIRYVLLAFAFAIYSLLGFNAYKRFRRAALSELWYNHHYEQVGKWMSENLPAGRTVFHTNWSDSQYLIGLNPKCDYFVTLDPIYMYYWNPKKYQLYRDIAFGRATDPYSLMKNDFSVDYGYAGKNYFTGLIDQIRKDNRFEVLAEDSIGLVFRLK